MTFLTKNPTGEVIETNLGCVAYSAYCRAMGWSTPDGNGSYLIEFHQLSNKQRARWDEMATAAFLAHTEKA